jgi:hypothetical protein
MTTENTGTPRRQAREVYLTGGSAEEFPLCRGSAVARLPQRRTRPPCEADGQRVRAHLERLLRSPHFDGSSRSREFLRYVVEEVLQGRGAYLKQAAIAVEVFGRTADFDGLIDPIVRVQAGRLRRSLERYYLLCGDADMVRIELPKGSYAPTFVENHAERGAPAASVVTEEWPSVLVMPFSRPGAAHEAAANQLREELAAELCRHGIVHVRRPWDAGGAAREGSRFEVQGFAFDGVASTVFAARLFDRFTGQQVWADEFHTSNNPGVCSGDAGEIGRVIAARIGAEHGVIARLLAGEHAARRFCGGDSFSAIARCHHFLFSHQVGALPQAIEALQELTRRAPEIELAWTSLGRLYLQNHCFELSSSFTPVEFAIACANQSVLLEPGCARTRCLMAQALLVKGELAAARRELDHAVRLNHDSLAYREMIGWLRALSGDWDGGAALMHDAQRRNPYCQPCVSHGLWADALRRGDFEAAYAAAIEYRDPNFFWRELMLTSSLGHLGRVEEASSSAMELLRVRPQFHRRGRHLIAHFIKSDELRAVIVDGLQKAGVAVA